MADFVVFNPREMKELAAQVKIAGVESEKAFYAGLLAAGEIVAKKARDNASFSTRIPATVAVRRRGTRVRIQAGGAKAPEAAPLEHHGIAGTFRHPVFGNREVWVDQKAHPFLTPAAVESETEVVAAVDALTDATFRALGL